MDFPFRSKEVSWLSFNARVLEEARRAETPLVERLRFLGIYSSNLDEFFRVRVATLKRLTELGKHWKKLGIPKPSRTLSEINARVSADAKIFNETYAEILAELPAHGIEVISDEEVPGELAGFLEDFFQETVLPRIMPVMIKSKFHLAGLRDKPMYLAVRMSRNGGRPAHALVEIPSSDVPRFVALPEHDGVRRVMYLDDIIRFGLPRIFATLPYDQFESYAIKFTRDAAIELDDDITESYFERLSDGLRARDVGRAVRLNYDSRIPDDFLQLLVKKLQITGEDTLFPGAPYHNRRDLMGFPALGNRDLLWPRLKPAEHPVLRSGSKSLFAKLRKGDQLVHLPYQDFSVFLDFLREASLDPLVRSIQLTQYRFAKKSAIVGALQAAVRSGKEVTVLVEPRARFDEEANIAYANEYQSSGIRVILGMPGLKVHSKLCLVERREGKKTRHYSVVGTGNFNESTARLYTDFHLFTANPEIGQDVQRVFRFFARSYAPPQLSRLICSPFALRTEFTRLVSREMENAKAGKRASIAMKINNLSDPETIELLYKASEAGVEVRLIVRSMFSLVTEQPGFSENIRAISIVGRLLEHSRVLVFHNDGDPQVFITSADFLPRNLDSRVEVTCPILDPPLRDRILRVMETHWRDSTNARVLDAELTNPPYVPDDPLPGSAQSALLDYY